MLDRARLLRKHDLLTPADRRRKTRTLKAQPREKCREAIKIILPVFFKRMMMALRTFQANTQEKLTDQRRNFLRLTAVAKQHRGSIVPSRAPSRNQLAHKLIVGLVPSKAIANPSVISHHRLDA